MFYSNQGPISYRFRNKRRFQSKLAKKNPTPRVLYAPAEGVPLGIEYPRWGSKTRMMGLPSREKFDDIFSCVDTIHQRDGRTDTGRQQRQRLRIASRGNKSEDLSLQALLHPTIVIQVVRSHCRSTFRMVHFCLLAYLLKHQSQMLRLGVTGTVRSEFARCSYGRRRIARSPWDFLDIFTHRTMNRSF